MNLPRVRFAPSPTGRMHIGSLRAALFNYLFAKKHGGTFILRIEDTDQSRTVPGALEDIVDTLHAYGLTPDEGLIRQDGKLTERGDHGPYVQSQRLDLYTKAANQLIQQGSAYLCFCTAERLQQLRTSQERQHLPTGYDGHCRDLDAAEVEQRRTAGESFVVRFRTPREGITSLDDMVRGTVQFAHKHLEDTVLLKSDGFPTYHLANVVDDHAMEISHVIRAEEWLPSAPLHLLLYAAFDWVPPTFAHLPLILGAGRKKLSKRDGDTAAGDYLQHYLPNAVLNFIALLGWNPKTAQEYFADVPALVKAFELQQVNRAGAFFDVIKLKHLNRQHMRVMNPVALATIAKLPFDADAATRYVPLIVERADTLEDLRTSSEMFTANIVQYDATILVPQKSTAEQTKTVLGKLATFLENLEASSWQTAATLRAACESWPADQGYSNRDAFWPLRVALSGRAVSPDVFALGAALGKTLSLSRIQAALQKL